MVAITTGRHLGTTLAMLGIHACLVKIIPGTDAQPHGNDFMSDGGMYRVYTRISHREKRKGRKESTA